MKADICGECGYPSFGSCGNPACLANPSLTDEVKELIAARKETLAREEEERGRLTRASGISSRRSVGGGVVDEDATAKLRQVKKLKARGDGTLNGAVLSAAWHAKKHGHSFYAYPRVTYMVLSWQVGYAENIPSRVEMPGKFNVYSVDEELTVRKHEVSA